MTAQGAALVAGAALLVAASAGPQPGASADLKVVTRYEVGGRRHETLNYRQGHRFRTEQRDPRGMPAAVTIARCDERREIHLMPEQKRYFVRELGEHGMPADSTPTSSEPSGVTVRVQIQTEDLGERREFFGMTAQRMRQTEAVEAPTGACLWQSRTTVREGWYLQEPIQFGCFPPPEHAVAIVTSHLASDRQCHDEVEMLEPVGPRLGFAMEETTTVTMADAYFSHRSEVTEFSRQPLQHDLFDIPREYSRYTSWHRWWDRLLGRRP
jgi:hypothetical protein